MINKYKLTFRYLWRNKLFTFLNILGLSIGISACWMIFRIVHYEFSFEKAIPDVEDIHQIVSLDDIEKLNEGFAGIPLGLPLLLTEQALPDVLLVPIYTQYFERILVPQGQNEENLTFEDPQNMVGTRTSYFDMLPYEWLEGNAKTALSAPNNVILTESRAKQYFPKLSTQEVIGKTFMGDTTQYVVSGIVKDLSFPSSFQGQIFFSIPEKEWTDHNWMGMNSNHLFFVKTKNPNALKHLLQVAQKEYDRIAAPEHAKFGPTIKFAPFPLLDKHFQLQYDTEGTSTEKKVVFGLIAIGAFLLTLACINYINLSTAQVPQRAKEIGIRKTLGAKPSSITMSFLVETFCITLLALFLSWPIVTIFKHIYPEFVSSSIDQYTNPWLLSLFLFGLILFITLVSAIYPAFLINRVRSIDTLKGKVDHKIKGTQLSLRKALIVFQFIIAQFFIVCALIMGKQLDFTVHTDLGFSHYAVVNITMPTKSYQHGDVNPFLYKQALQKHPEIAGVALGHEPLNSSYWGNVYYLKVDTGRVQLNTPRKYIDQDYIDLYEIELLAGKNIQFSDTMREILINESALKALGLKNPNDAIGQHLTTLENVSFPIVGVYKDFNQRSLRSKMGPLLLGSSNKRSLLQMFNIKLPEDRKKWSGAIAIMEQEWKKIYPNAPFEYKFNEERIKKIYENDLRTAKLIDLATIVTILVSCLGLFGLSTLTAFQRTKEIGIRKVLGASVGKIVAMLSKEFVKLVFISILLASPLAWWVMHKWLEDFAYRIDIPWWIFLVAGLCATVIALFTVSYQAVKAAIVNPVDSLRDE